MRIYLYSVSILIFGIILGFFFAKDEDRQDFTSAADCFPLKINDLQKEPRPASNQTKLNIPLEPKLSTEEVLKKPPLPDDTSTTVMQEISDIESVFALSEEQRNALIQGLQELHAQSVGKQIDLNLYNELYQRVLGEENVNKLEQALTEQAKTYRQTKEEQKLNLIAYELDLPPEARETFASSLKQAQSAAKEAIILKQLEQGALIDFTDPVARENHIKQMHQLEENLLQESLRPLLSEAKYNKFLELQASGKFD